MTTSDAIEIAAEIAAAFVSNNSLPAGELPALIEGVHAALKKSVGAEEVVASLDPPAPAVSIRKSITPDYLICLEDGKRFKSMRRHLALLGMTPEQYRAKWDLPSTYPMVAANYAARRSAMAKSFGLGRTQQAPVAAEPATVVSAEAIAPASTAPSKRKPGRPRKPTA